MAINHELENIYSLNEIIKKIYKSIKFIFITAAIVSILGYLYASQKPIIYQSKALIEIGNFDSVNKSEPLSSVGALIQELVIHFVHKKNYEEGINPNNLKIRPIQGRLIELKYDSSTVTLNEKFLNNVINYAEEIHLDIINLRKQEGLENLDYELEKLDKEMEFLKSQYETKKEKTSNKIKLLKNEFMLLSDSYEFEIRERINFLENKLIFLDEKINNFQDIAIQDSENLKFLKTDSELMAERAKISPTLDQIISGYKLEIIELNNEKRRIEAELNLLNVKLSNLNLHHNDSEELFNLGNEINSNEEDLLNFKVDFSERMFLLDLEKEKKILEFDIEFNEAFTKRTKVVQEVKSSPKKINKIRYAFLSFVIGLVLALLLILGKDSLSILKSNVNQ